MMALLNDKVVLITGASAGIGRAAAVACGNEGARLVVSARRQIEGEETAELVRATGAPALFVQADVSRDDDVRRLVEAAVERFGGLDCAFNNAGAEQDPEPLTEQAEATYHRIMDTNVKGVWLSMKYEIPQMLKRGAGAIVNTSSVAGIVGFAGAPIYAASKHAVVGLTRSVALEYAAHGIRVNAINPGAVETDMYRRFTGDKPEMQARMLALHPIGRIARPEEIADAVVYLFSGKASFVTGHTLVLDGGFSAG
jgi:NAD(P)-dependent dehydrogenase (short-subunit alcohol dehydrogenase family)